MDAMHATRVSLRSRLRSCSSESDSEGLASLRGAVEFFMGSLAAAKPTRSAVPMACWMLECCKGVSDAEVALDDRLEVVVLLDDDEAGSTVLGQRRQEEEGGGGAEARTLVEAVVHPLDCRLGSGVPESCATLALEPGQVERRQTVDVVFSLVRLLACRPPYQLPKLIHCGLKFSRLAALPAPNHTPYRLSILEGELLERIHRRCR